MALPSQQISQPKASRGLRGRLSVGFVFFFALFGAGLLLVGSGLWQRFEQWRVARSLQENWNDMAMRVPLSHETVAGQLPLGRLSIPRLDLKAVVVACGGDAAGQPTLDQLSSQVQVISAPADFRWTIGPAPPLGELSALQVGDRLEWALRPNETALYKVVRIQAQQQLGRVREPLALCDGPVLTLLPERLVLTSRTHANAFSERSWMIRIIAEKLTDRPS